jgi:hypothetical protein
MIVNVKLEQDEYEWLKQLAHDNARSLRGQLRTVLREAMMLDGRVLGDQEALTDEHEISWDEAMGESG